MARERDRRAVSIVGTAVRVNPSAAAPEGDAVCRSALAGARGHGDIKPTEGLEGVV